MDINIRNKERQSGKTTDVMEMVEILLSLDRKVVLLVHNMQALQILKKDYKDILLNNDYIGRLIVGISNSIDFIRGHRFDTFIIDELSLNNNIDSIKSMADACNAVIYATDNISYHQPIFSGKSI